MAVPDRRPDGGWLTFSCPFCKANLRIRRAYAHARGRCPECGVRIEAPAPRGGEATVQDVPGLAPIEEEWPEPAEVDDQDQPAYDVARGPVTWTEPPASQPLGEGYALSDGELSLLPAEKPAPSVAPYDVAPTDFAPPPLEDEAFHEIVGAEPTREPPPPPPPYPLWSGLYAFPARRENLLTWLYLSLDFTFLAAVTALMVRLYQLEGVYQVGVVLLIPVLGIALFWIGCYAADCFLVVIEETGAGNDKVGWPRGVSIADGLSRMLYVAWILACASIPAILWIDFRGVPGAGGRLWWVFLGLPTFVIFPVMLLSSMSANSRWVLVHARIVGGLVRRPTTVFLVWLAPLALAVPLGWFGYQLLSRLDFRFTVAVGVATAAYLLIYARLIGRAGWMIVEPRPRRRRKRARRATALAAAPEVQGWGPEEPDASAPA
jgi:hypothetical protein